MARPTKLNKKLLLKAQEYLLIYPEMEQVVPSIVGLAVHLNISRSTVNLWASDEYDTPLYREFSDIVGDVLKLQEQVLINNGLSRAFDSSMTKLLLTKHGYADKQESTNNVNLNHEQWLDSLS